MGIEIETKGRVVTVTPTVDTAIYASGDRIGSIMEFTNALDDSSGTATIQSVTIVDKAAQSSILQILFFNDLPTVASADNAALNITDAEMAAKCIGHVSVVAADYFALSASSVACVRNINLLVTSVKSSTNTTGKSIWGVIRSGGTPTYTSTSDLVISVGLKQD
jgi:hypothetical protein